MTATPTPPDPFRLDGKTALVTGATGALGSAMCHALARAGAQVIVLARNRERIDALVEAIRSAGGQAHGVSADVLDRQRLAQVAADLPRLDVLVNGAGGNVPQATVQRGERSFFDLPTSALDQVLQLNLHGSVIPTQVFGARMAQAGAGSIINVSSMASLRPLTRVMGYGMAKAALNNLTQWLAVYMATEHSPQIRVNAIAPGFFLGEQNRYLLIDRDTGELTARGRAIIAQTPAGRFGEPDDLSGALVWLAGDAARFVTGVVIPVDGGFSAFSL